MDNTNTREYFTSAEVADLLSVSIDTVRAWRQPKYGRSKKHLVGERLSHSAYVYHVDTLEAWLQTNPDFRARTIGWRPAAQLPKTLISRLQSIVSKTTNHNQMEPA